MIALHDKVEKIGGDYIFVGIVVSIFAKLSGQRRYVVEDDRGVLHVYSEKTLRKLTTAEWVNDSIEVYDIRTIELSKDFLFFCNHGYYPSRLETSKYIFDISLTLTYIGEHSSEQTNSRKTY